MWTICQGRVDYPAPSKTAILQSRKGGLRETPGTRRKGQQINHNESTLILLPAVQTMGSTSLAYRWLSDDLARIGWLERGVH